MVPSKGFRQVLIIVVNKLLQAGFQVRHRRKAGTFVEQPPNGHTEPTFPP